MLAPDTVIGDYRIVGILGRGGMAVVYEAVHGSLERRVALKVLGPELGSDPAFVARFRREGRLQASLDHPHIVTVYEAGESDHGLFLAMRLIRGATLAALASEGRLDAGRALRLLRQVAEALDAAHSAGLVHRDVKPHNVLVGADDDAYLADFGLTRFGAGVTLTGADSMAGTLAYLAPEIIAGDPPTPASDRYAFAALAFECLAGGELFPYRTPAAVMYAHTSEDPPRISERRDELPGSLDDVFANALAKDPRRRPATAAGLVDSLEQALGAEVERLGPPPRAPSATSDAMTFPPPGADSQPRRRHAPAVLATASALAGAAVAAIALALLAGGEDGDRNTRAAEPAPRVPAGSQVLGSRLEATGQVRTLDCRGRPPSPASPGCSVTQEALPDRVVLAPRDGAIRGWAVRGAVGELSLQILRERDAKLKQVSKSQVELASDASPHRFVTNLPVESGDAIALVVSPGAGIGVRDGVSGATTSRWLPRLRGFFESPTAGPGSGFDHELLLRADYVPNGEVRLPPQINGARAASAPDGKVLGRESVTLVEGGHRVQLVVVEVGDAVALDLLRNQRRVARVTLPRFRPQGRLTTFAATPEGFVDLEWINLDSGRALFEFFGFDSRSFIYYGS